MRKIFFTLLIFVIIPFTAFSQKTLTGTVIDDTNEPLIGVSVVVKGTSLGTITDFDGNYSLSGVPNEATIVFSYVGMQGQERKLTASQTTLNVTLKADALVIEEVVVTAMGIRQEKKRMNFAVQSVDADKLVENKSANFVNALQGKIAGLSVTNSSGSPNSGSQVIIRGISSINPAQNNEPLFVLDGMPISGGGSAAADINPNDIENITVLKGAAAAALYGQDAANGVIMITTKRGEAGKVGVTANIGLQLDVPTRVEKLQTTYGHGSEGFYKEKTMGGWGPMLPEGTQIYDNVNNFLNNGFYHKYDVSMTGGTEKFQAYASANYSQNNGIVPNDYLNRLGVLLKATFQPIKSLTFNASANIINTKSRSFGSTGMSSVYNWPITDDITDYELVNKYPRFLYYSDVNKYNSPISPLYSRYNDNGLNTKTRNIINGSVTWTPVKNLSITGRVNYETSHSSYDGYSVPRWDDSVILDLTPPAAPEEGASQAILDQYNTELAAYQEFFEHYSNVSPYLSKDDIKDMNKDLLGAYSTTMGRSELFVAGALVTYKVDLPSEFSIDMLAGTEMKMQNGLSTSVAGRDFIIPGTYSLQNTNPDLVFLTDRTSTHSKYRTFGYFGELRGDYKGLASLSVTGRWDWSSRIKTNPYFYPSITAGLLFSELFEISNDWFNYGKLRGNYAFVGKDPSSPSLFDRKFKQFATYPDNGYGIDPTLSSADDNLAPEMSFSWEIGADFRLFNNKTRLDIAYYSVGVDNQIVTVRVSPTSGHILQTRNEGSIRNQGVEISLDQDIYKTKDFSWTALFNFGLNRGRVISLPEEISEITGPQYGDIFTSAYLGGSTTALTGKDYLRTDDGKIIVGEDGLPQIGADKNKLIGNREPLFIAGLTNSFKYKDLSFSFLVDGRLGGDVANITSRGLLSNGQSRMLEHYRGRQVVVDGVVKQADGSYEPNTTAITLDHNTLNNYFYAVSSNFIEDGSFIRLSYVTIGYDLSRYVKGTALNSLRVNFTGNNLFLLTRYTGADPTRNADTSGRGTGSAGIDNYGVPGTRGFNFSLAASF